MHQVHHILQETLGKRNTLHKKWSFPLSSRLQMFCTEGVLKVFVKFTGKQMRGSLFDLQPQALLKIKLFEIQDLVPNANTKGLPDSIGYF